MTNRDGSKQLFVYVGSYANHTDSGIYTFSFDTETGALSYIDSVDGIANPSYLAVDYGRSRLYAVSEVMETGGQPGGAVAAYSVQSDNGKLTLMNRQLTHGGAPCHLSIDHTGSCLFAVNYAGGNVCLFPIHDDGSLGEAAHVVSHHGRGVLPDRQEGPHPHSILPDPTNRFALVADLGIDAIKLYRIDTAACKLVPHGEAGSNPGAGPRHFVFHPNGAFLYVINELDSSITTFAYDAEEGKLAPIQTVPTLPPDYAGKSTCADIHILKSGKFLYGSNRGHDSISVFAVDETDGTLTFVEHVPTMGKTPRNFAVSPDGRFLLAANQDSDSIVTFAIDPDKGTLRQTGDIIMVSRPVCIKFFV